VPRSTFGGTNSSAMVFKVNELLLIQRLVPAPRQSAVANPRRPFKRRWPGRARRHLRDSIERPSKSPSGDGPSRRRAGLVRAKPAGQRHAE
jgi:hypothetical protein